jgi:hypothetical protein
MASLLRSPQPMHYPPTHHSFQFPPSRTPASFYPTRTPPPPQSHSPLATNQLPGLHAGAMYTGNVLGPSIGPAEESKIYALVVDLMDPGTRESALLELSKKREQYDELALVLWHSFGMPPWSSLNTYAEPLQESWLASSRKSSPSTLFSHLRLLLRMPQIEFAMRWPYCNVSLPIQTHGNYF